MCVSVQNLTRFSSLVAAGSLLLSATASAQSFNVDFGLNTVSPVPSDAYGAASGSVGRWNPASSGLFAQPLQNLDGSPATATVSESGSLGSFGFDNVGTSGDDGNLLDDYLDLGGPGNISSTTFDGLTNGNYDVYTYAWAADNRTGFCSQVSVTGSADPQQVVCGAWTGANALGITYALHNVDVTTGTIEILVEATPTGTFGTINGFQIIQNGGSNTGSGYCFGDSGNCPAAAVGAAGQGCPNTNPNGNGALLVGTGDASFGGDTFGVAITDGAFTKPGILIQGAAPISFPNGNPTVPDSAGLFCVNPQLRGDVFFTDGAGAAAQGSFSSMPFGATAQPVGSTTYLQYWFRDPGNPNANAGPGAEFNFSNALMVNWNN